MFKPDPEILRYACKRLNVSPEETLYVGDHPFDVVCAHAASVHAAWIPANKFMRPPGGTEAPLFRLQKLEELGDILEKNTAD